MRAGRTGAGRVRAGRSGRTWSRPLRTAQLLRSRRPEGLAAMARTRRDLDAWATALDVRNDDDAKGVLGRLLLGLSDTHAALAESSRLVNRAPDGDVTASLSRAMGNVGEAMDELTTVLLSFAAHERG